MLSLSSNPLYLSESVFMTGDPKKSVVRSMTWEIYFQGDLHGYGATFYFFSARQKRSVQMAQLCTRLSW